MAIKVHSKFLLFFMFVHLISCSKKTVQQSEIIPIKGDPLNFIKDTDNRTGDGISVATFIQNNKWMIYSTGFKTEPQEKLVDQNEAKEKNKPIDKEFSKKNETIVPIYEFKKNSNELFTLSTNKAEGIGFNFLKRNGAYFVDSVFNMANGFKLSSDKFQIHHYSVHKSGKAFSILISFQEGNLKYLINYIFVAQKPGGFLTKSISENYNYYFGPGVAVGWEQKEILKITICESQLQGLSNLSESALKQWQKALNKRLDLQADIIEKSKCPPFSDLNSHTILHVKGYIEYFGKALQQGSTFIVPNFFDSEILDGDIFILESDWDEALGDGKKLSDTKSLENFHIKVLYQTTIAHELGHLLGLHHQFSPEIPSIMGYDDVNELTNYDYKAIQELYPLR
jgi:hypothetical protein